MFINKKFSVIIADDHPLTRAGLAQKLFELERFDVIAEAQDGKTAFDMTLKLQPDILLLDIEMPLMTGIEVANLLTKSNSNTKILALSAYDKREYVYGVLDSGANGYLKKDEANSVMLSEALNAILDSGDTWLSPEMSTKLVQSLIKEKHIVSIIASLSNREREILLLIAKGIGNQDIADTLFISVHTVKNHVDHIRQKIGIKSRNELIAWAWSNKLLGI